MSKSGVVRKQGYKLVYEHRLVWERSNCACLLKWSNVHHKDGNIRNNNPSNLQAMMAKDHAKIPKNGYCNNSKYNVGWIEAVKEWNDIINIINDIIH